MRVKKNRDTLEQSYLLYLTNKSKSECVDLKTYKKVIYAFNKEVASYIIDSGETYKLPHKLGELKIRRSKMKYKKFAFDFQYWKETGETSFYLNQHSNGYVAKFFWNRCKISGKKAYEFILSRDNKRRIAAIMQKEDGYKIYQEFKPKIKKKINGI